MSIRVNESSRSAGEVYTVAASRTSSRAAISSHFIWPASGDRSEGTPVLRWLPEVRRRVEELASCPEGWDGNHARPLQASALNAVMPLLQRYGSYIQSAPSVSLSPDGGLICRWDRTEYTVQLESAPDGDVEVYFADANGDEHDVPVTRAPELDKWLWQASVDF